MTDSPARADAAEPTHERFPTRVTSDPGRARQFAIEAARLVRDDKCARVRVLDVSALSQVTDFLVIATGTSERQMRATLHHVRALGAERGFPAFGSSADEGARWLLADFVDVVVHLFEPVAREHYDLEMLWGDAPRVEWLREGEREDDRYPGSDSEVETGG